MQCAQHEGACTKNDIITSHRAEYVLVAHAAFMEVRTSVSRTLEKTKLNIAMLTETNM